MTTMNRKQAYLLTVAAFLLATIAAAIFPATFGWWVMYLTNAIMFFCMLAVQLANQYHREREYQISDGLGVAIEITVATWVLATITALWNVAYNNPSDVSIAATIAAVAFIPTTIVTSIWALIVAPKNRHLQCHT